MTHEAIAAYAGVVIAALAFFVTIWAMVKQHQHNYKSVTPLPWINLRNSDDGIHVKIQNHGTGPLVVESITVKKGTETRLSLIDWMGKDVDWTDYLETDRIAGRGLSPGSELLLFQWKPDSSVESKSLYHQCRALLSDLTLRLEFKDIYGREQSPIERSFSYFKENNLIEPKSINAA